MARHLRGARKHEQQTGGGGAAYGQVSDLPVCCPGQDAGQATVNAALAVNPDCIFTFLYSLTHVFRML
jgi:hypothetical protein